MTRLQMTQAPVHAAAQRLPLLVILYLLCVAVPISFQAGALYLTTLRLLLLLTTLPLLARVLMGKYGPTLPTDWLFLGHAIWICLSLAVNNPDRIIQQAPSVGVEFLGGYLIARACIRTPETFLAVSRWIIMIVICTIPFALQETMSGNPLLLRIISAVPGVTTVNIVDIEARLGFERVQANFSHPIHYGLFCSIAFSMAFVALKDVFSRKRRFLTAGAVAFSGFLALSSGALLAILLQMGLILWAAIFAGFKGRWWLLLGVFALFYVVIDITSDRTPLRVFMSYATFSAHNAFWRGIIFEWGVMNIFGNATEGIPPAVWFGVGHNDWVRPTFMPSASIDNFWLLMAVRYGVPAFVFIALGWGVGLLGILRRPFEEQSTVGRIRRSYMFTFIGLTLTLATVHVWTNIYSFVFFIFGAGMWMMRFNPEGQTSPEDVSARKVSPHRPSEATVRPQPVFTRFAKTRP
ncbi:MAG: O-antigen ligase domain-containing protein, partial [Jannaschia sp.]